MSVFENGRLCLLFEAGGSRFAVEATSVTEVAAPDQDGKRLRGTLELKDLSRLLGGPAEEPPGMAVVLDTSPTLAVRIRRVLEVVNVAGAPVWMLPPGLREQAGPAVRGALLKDGKLFLELVPEAVPQQPPPPLTAPSRSAELCTQVPERGLIFESQGRLFGVALPLVSQVVHATLAFSALPGPSGPVAGIFPHAQSLWPIYSAPALLGGTALPEPYFVLAELAGQNTGLCASRVLGVYSHFEPTVRPGEFLSPQLDASAVFLDLQRMFS